MVVLFQGMSALNEAAISPCCQEDAVLFLKLLSTMYFQILRNLLKQKPLSTLQVSVKLHSHVDPGISKNKTRGKDHSVKSSHDYFLPQIP